ncbi:restriction endonuclease subunit S [Leifsonia sp. NPDC056665]|uniref:restriction endonuclease subunit S n=1 Tax=Leifsonia sp. NPDC056665 TaxID=3345901 RepID=UPI003683FFBD
MTGLQPYGRLRTSKLAWAPELPEHWSESTIGRIATVYAGGTPDRGNPTYWEGGTIPWLNSGSVNDWVITEPSELITPLALAGSSTRWVPPRSIVMALAGQGRTKGMAARVELETTLNQSLAAVVPTSAVEYRFVQYWLAANYASIRNLAGGDLRDGLNLQHIKSVGLPLPPIAEQRAIADFLDRETAEIDAFIEDQEELIRVLSERRDATISSAVTRGLDRDALLKQTGIAWLPQMPAHWRLGRLRDAVRSSRNGVWGGEPGTAFDIRCVRVADFDRPSQRVRDDNVTYRSVLPSERVGRILHEGDLLLEKSGGGEKSPVGFVVLYDKSAPAICSNFVARIVLGSGQHPKYWSYVHRFFYAARLTQRSIKQSTGIQNLDQGSYFDERIGIPPITEQEDIAAYLDTATAEIDASVADAREAIALLRERRAALISAAVTGKIDVLEGSATNGSSARRCV